LLSTYDGGESWLPKDLPIDGDDIYAIASAYPNFVDQQNGWVAIKLQSGNNFSLGRLFATQDGGATWEELAVPLGEPVKFVDRDRGWIAGGPLGDQLFRTLDGGRTWSEQILPLPARGNSDSLFIQLPEFTGDLNGTLPVTLTGPGGSRQAIYTTSDGGLTWTQARLVELGAEDQPAGSLPFSLDESGRWWAATPGTSRLFNGLPGREVQTIIPTGFSGTIVDLEFGSSEAGWALVQDGSCEGDKSLAGGETFRCELRTILAGTKDGGMTWTIQALPD
jgi:photosystem II stability/assembly factor-like uncharacterized protein